MAIAEDCLKRGFLLEGYEPKASGFIWSAKPTAFLVLYDDKVKDFAILGEVVEQLAWVSAFLRSLVFKGMPPMNILYSLAHQVAYH